MHRTTGNDVHMSPHERWLRAVPQPRGVNSKGCDLGFILDGWVFALTTNRAFRLVIKFLSDSAYAIFQTGGGNGLIDRENFFQKLGGSRKRKMRRPCDLEVFQFRAHAKWHGLCRRAKRCCAR